MAEGPDGVYLIDYHAAHERVLFDRLEKQWSSRAVESQGLLSPATIEVSPAQEEILKSGRRDWTEFGFAIEPFGDRTYLVRAIPQLLWESDWLAALRELLDSLCGEGEDKRQERMLMSIACHGAVRAGKALSDDEMRELVRQLEQTANPHTCPHGRPTMIHLSSGRLEREFGRS